jgi:hypothetical protein
MRMIAYMICGAKRQATYWCGKKMIASTYIYNRKLNCGDIYCMHLHTVWKDTRVYRAMLCVERPCPSGPHQARTTCGRNWMLRLVQTGHMT